MRVVKLNATDHLDVEAFRRLLTALRGSSGDARRAIAREAAGGLRAYIAHSRPADPRLTSLVDAFEEIRSN